MFINYVPMSPHCAGLCLRDHNIYVRLEDLEISYVARLIRIRNAKYVNRFNFPKHPYFQDVAGHAIVLPIPDRMDELSEDEMDTLVPKLPYAEAEKLAKAEEQPVKRTFWTRWF